VNGEADRTRLIHDSLFHVPTDPPDGVGRKAEATFRIEFLYRMDKAEISFLDQIQEGEPAVEIAMRDLDHQPQVADDHALACSTVTAVGEAGETGLFLGRQQLGAADLVEVQTGRIQVTCPSRVPILHRIRRSIILARPGAARFRLETIRRIFHGVIVDLRLRIQLVGPRHADITSQLGSVDV